MNRRTKILLTLTVLLVTGLAVSCYFVSAFAPPKITVTKDQITTNGTFTNGVSIEKIRVDSIGPKGYPVQYTTVYTTQCKLQQTGSKPLNLKKIAFAKPGSYTWAEDTVAVRYRHTGLSRKPLDSISKTWWLQKFGHHPVCPISFEKGQWYFITGIDPQVTGIFFYIEPDGNEKQFYLESGVSPI